MADQGTARRASGRLGSEMRTSKRSVVTGTVTLEPVISTVQLKRHPGDGRDVSQVARALLAVK